MVVRLSELLDRIRPAGAPGAPSSAAPRRELDAREEIAGLAGRLATYEADADAIVAAARERAASIRAEAERSARRIRADVADRVAVARAGWTEGVEQHADGEATQIAERADAEIAAVRERARVDAVADDAVALLWELVGGAP